VNGAAVEDVPICFDDNCLQSLVDRATARGIPPEEPLVLMSLGAFQRNLAQRNGPGGGEHTGSRVEQDVEVKVVPSVNGHLGCIELSFSFMTTGVQQVDNKGTRQEISQRVVTTEDAVALQAKLKAHTELAEYAPVDHNDHVQLIHGFLPPIKQEETKRIHEPLNHLEKNFAMTGTFDENGELRAVVRSTRECLHAEKQHCGNVIAGKLKCRKGHVLQNMEAGSRSAL
jgi:hypothetical protein